MAHENKLFSASALTDGSENVVERYRYDAYGGCAMLDADGSADSDGISDVGNAYAFTGRRLDIESGLMQYRNRYYSPTLGRFTSRDPAGYVDGWSPYQYAGSNPSLLTDPSGERAANEDAFNCCVGAWSMACFLAHAYDPPVLAACIGVGPIVCSPAFFLPDPLEPPPPPDPPKDADCTLKSVRRIPVSGGIISFPVECMYKCMYDGKTEYRYRSGQGINPRTHGKPWPRSCRTKWRGVLISCPKEAYHGDLSTIDKNWRLG